MRHRVGPPDEDEPVVLVDVALVELRQPDVVAEICRNVGRDWDVVSKRITADDIKAKLRANTEEVIARGGFGSPTMFVNKTDMYFGNDRLPLVEAALSHG